MPLSDNSRLIPGFLQQFRISLLTTVKRAGIIRKAIGMTMFAGKHTSPAGTTDRIGNKTVCKSGSLLSYTINIRSLYQLVIISTDCLIRMIVTHNIEYVHRPFFLFQSTG